MKRLVGKYLDSLYFISDNQIWVKDMDYPIRCRRLVSDLSLVFGLSKDDLETHVRSWVNSKNKRIRFKRFWKDNRNNVHVDDLFPVIRQIYASAPLASELISVQPLSAPSGMLSYLDYHIVGAKKKAQPKIRWWNKFYSFIKKIFEKEVKSDIIFGNTITMS